VCRARRLSDRWNGDAADRELRGRARRLDDGLGHRFTEGDHDDGTAWATTELEPVDASRFSVTVQAWSESESFNHLRDLVAYLGPQKPSDEGSFPGPGDTSTGVDGAEFGGLREPLHLAEGWREYSFEWTPGTVPDRLAFAVGVSVVWEADATHYVDDVEVVTR